MACNTLELYIARMHLEPQAKPKAEAQPCFTIHSIGKRALHWLLSSEKAEPAGFPVGDRLAHSTTHSLVAESERDNARTWISGTSRPFQPYDPQSSADRLSDAFNGAKMRGLLAAQAFWTSKRSVLEMPSNLSGISTLSAMRLSSVCSRACMAQGTTRYTRPAVSCARCLRAP